ncbi:hypothetical protein [Mesorhizobium sp. ES1-1]|uniref:hypothetical protein n=1 Tax=Mesorhizobium sp. ES1-1 TaxID=2876629 RepID=UPI001CCB60E8|nr:hypothetical protein [Mesorhizobium sp. ES1-1]MBZ9678923.1 hypothetical protein [Mesorhizobium sp. ES1-1]
MSFDIDEHRASAARLARTVASVVEAEMLAAPPVVRVVDRKVMTRVDKATLEAAWAVANAMAAYDQAKFAGGREVAARKAVERACRSLHTQLRNREAKHARK